MIKHWTDNIFIFKKKLFFLIIFFSFLLIIISQNNLSRSKINQIFKQIYFDSYDMPEIEEISQCELEWQKLNQNVHFRKNLAFYYLDLNKINMYLERNKNIQYKYKLLIEIIWKNNFYKNYITNVNSYSLRTDDLYVFEYIETDFNIKQLNISLNLNEKFSFKVRVEVIDNPSISTSKPINLITKNFNTNNNNDKKHSVLCGKTYYYENNHLNYYKWWLNINKINGYDKIVLFNNSYGNGNWSQFNDLFSKYKDLVQVVQFQCLPNFLDLNMGLGWVDDMAK